MAFGTRSRSSTSSRALVGVLGEHLARPPDQARRRLVARRRQEVHVAEHLRPAEAPGGAGLVLELGLEQLGHEVVGGWLARHSMYSSKPLALTDALGVRRLDVGHGALRRAAGRRRCGRGWPPGPARECPSSMPMVRMGIWAPRSAMKSKRPAPTRGSRLRAQNSRTLGSSALMLRGVKTRDSRRRCRWWAGGSSKMMEPGGISMPLLMSSSSGALARDVGLPVERAPRRRPRTGSARRSRTARCSRAALVAQPLPDGVRVRVDLEVVRVVVDRRIPSRSWLPPSAAVTCARRSCVRPAGGRPRAAVAGRGPMDELCSLLLRARRPHAAVTTCRCAELASHKRKKCVLRAAVRREEWGAPRRRPRGGPEAGRSIAEIDTLTQEHHRSHP